MLVRTWNVFHGNTQPPERHAFLEEMVRLVSQDSPDVVALQELPVWSHSRLGAWSGMDAVSDVAARPRLGSGAAAAEIGRRLTSIHHGLLRSALTGQANALLVSPSFSVVDHRPVVLNPWSLRRREGRRLGLAPNTRRRWAWERRVCQVVRIARSGSTLVVANIHATGARDKRLPDAELLRAAAFVDGFANPGEAVVLAGDFNVTLGESSVLPSLLSTDWGFNGATPEGVDHVLVRGAVATQPVRWPLARRRLDGRVLSDHAPVERSLS